MRIIKWFGVLAIFCCIQHKLNAQESIAQIWTEHLLFAVKNDFARPTVHARNLFHSSVAMHDAWAAYDGQSEFYFLGKTHEGQLVPFKGIAFESDTLAAQHEAICYAVFRLMTHRFQNSPGASNSIPRINAFMDSLSYDRTFTSTDYLNDGPAALGNYIAAKIIEIGYLDGSNEINGYANQYYSPVQSPVEPEFPGNPDMIDPNRWQPIALSFAVDQAGNILTSNPPFLSPEWGNVTSFAIPPSAESTFMRNGDTYKVFHDPGPPPYLDTTVQTQLESLYKWNFTMVSVWQSHLDPNDTTVWDISPASIGNIPNYPNSFANYDTFYDYYDGGDSGQGYALNPKTNMPYTPQLVKRADYARVLAEFWADGLDSETPPGHWYNIYNEVRQHPLFENKWKGSGPELSNLAYDVKAYLTIGGAMHDAAISAWSIKGWYDYARPVSAIRYMAEKGQSTIDSLANYHPAGLPLVPGYIEIVQLGDSLAGSSNQHVGKVKLFTWRGPDYISNPDTTYAGVGWILAENWWPYQRPSFVTPPFAGYLSGHSTFSRAAAEVMTFITGDPFFPGGMSSFSAQENEFLEFEEGPSTDIILEWATYKDASDQCSLSRIWGGIHPPADDINGRLIGAIIGQDASAKADSIFTQPIVKVDSVVCSLPVINISNIGQSLKLIIHFSDDMNTNVNPMVSLLAALNPLSNSLSLINETWVNSRTFELMYTINASMETIKPIAVQVQNGLSLSALEQLPYVQNEVLFIDLVRPELLTINASVPVLNDSVVSNSSFYLDLNYSEACDTSINPSVQFNNPGILNTILFEDPNQSAWLSANIYRQVYTAVDNDVNIVNIEVAVSGALDIAQNAQLLDSSSANFAIITTNPSLVNFTWSDSILNRADIGINALTMNIEFGNPMDTSSALFPEFSLSGINPGILGVNSAQSFWLNSSSVQVVFNLLNQDFQGDWFDISLFPFKDSFGNPVSNYLFADALRVDTKRPEVTQVQTNTNIVSDTETGTNAFLLDITFDEGMNTNKEVIAELFYNGSLSTEINFKVFQSMWLNDSTYQAYFEVEDNDLELQNHDLQINFGEDFVENPQDLVIRNAFIDLDTRNPRMLTLTADKYELTNLDSQWEITAVFDEEMDTTTGVELAFNVAGTSNVLTVNNTLSNWINSSVYQLVYDVLPNGFYQDAVSVSPSLGNDTAQNLIMNFELDSFVSFKLDAVGIAELYEDLKIYPVPAYAGQHLKFDIGKNMTVIAARMTNELGQEVFADDLIEVSNGKGMFKIPNHLSGVYFVEFTLSNSIVRRKIFIYN